MLKVHHIAPDTEFLCKAEKNAFPLGIEKAIESIWVAETARRGYLFNGTLISVRSTNQPELPVACELSEYRYFLAQRRDPTLYKELAVRPLAVTGILFCADGVVFGERSTDVEMDVGLLESVPAGGVDDSCLINGTLDLKRQLLTELVEEIGIDESAVMRVSKPFLMIEDDENHVFDICMLVETGMDKRQICEIHAKIDRPEYTSLHFLPISEAVALIQQRDRVAPLTSLLFETIMLSNATQDSGAIQRVRQRLLVTDPRATTGNNRAKA